ncbi:MAG: PTS system mannose/fructose/sorbose family transporter subunit IID, partial [Acutalibacteraceae bacterium]
MYIQISILDAIAPGILSMLTVLAVYTYLKKGGTMLKATFIILIAGLILGSLGILGIPSIS